MKTRLCVCYLTIMYIRNFMSHNLLASLSEQFDVIPVFSLSPLLYLQPSISSVCYPINLNNKFSSHHREEELGKQ
uniref:Uncharacterized protein n=1 Tax=Octopus bimaculoides TaxID=37653 RepID=A0A0L8HW31_OCTBM